ncbi:hypothetical protein HGO21_16920 [Acinetobacter sp. CUI P1]|nr:hypothetical protein [Acinetobacter sp. CUI P1]
MPKVSSKGQIRFPARWLKIMGGINTGEWVFFHIHKEEQIVYVTKDSGHSSFCTQMLGNSVLTIPNDIRKLFNVKPGDDLELEYDADKKALYFKKHSTSLTCPTCGGHGTVSNWRRNALSSIDLNQRT